MPDREQRLRELAYQLWEQAGYPHGRADEFWLAAEKLLAAEEPPPDPAPEPAP